MQWIPRGYQRGKGGESLLLGDILVAFARKSMRNPRELIYVFSNVTEGTWEEFQSATSLGRKVKALGGGIPLDGVSKALYLVLHGEESGKDPWEDWIWEYPEFSDTRADNERIK
jgi:hypothetical protein